MGRITAKRRGGVAVMTVTVSTNKVGSECENTFEFDPAEYTKADGSLDHEALEEIARDMMFEMIEWNWTLDTGEGEATP
jgi:hypothetical protein